MKVIITGGCGFIGANLVKYLAGRGIMVRVLDNLSTCSRQFACSGAADGKTRNPGLDLVVGDIRDKEVVNSSVQGMDAIVHLAAHTGIVKSLENPAENFDINVAGTVNVLEACRRNGVGKFIFASSNAAVGQQVPPVDELKLPKPISPYGAAKLAGEALCSAYYQSFGIKTAALRFAGCYGPYSEHKTSVIISFMKMVKEGKPVTIYGDGNQTRDFIHVEDVCQAIYLCLTMPEAKTDPQDCWGEVFQVATGVETTINSLVDLIGIVTGKTVTSVHQPERKGEIRRNYSDISKASARLGFRPLITLQRGLRDLSEWLNAVNK